MPTAVPEQRGNTKPSKRSQEQEMYMQRQADANATQSWFAGSQKSTKLARLDIVTHYQQGALLH